MESRFEVNARTSVPPSGAQRWVVITVEQKVHIFQACLKTIRTCPYVH